MDFVWTVLAIALVFLLIAVWPELVIFVESWLEANS